MTGKPKVEPESCQESQKAASTRLGTIKALAIIDRRRPEADWRLRPASPFSSVGKVDKSPAGNPGWSPFGVSYHIAFHGNYTRSTFPVALQTAMFY